MSSSQYNSSANVIAHIVHHTTTFDETSKNNTPKKFEKSTHKIPTHSNNQFSISTHLKKDPVPAYENTFRAAN